MENQRQWNPTGPRIGPANPEKRSEMPPKPTRRTQSGRELGTAASSYSLKPHPDTGVTTGAMDGARRWGDLRTDVRAQQKR
jgi:hypothetical protein